MLTFYCRLIVQKFWLYNFDPKVKFIELCLVLKFISKICGDDRSFLHRIRSIPNTLIFSFIYDNNACMMSFLGWALPRSNTGSDQGKHILHRPYPPLQCNRRRSFCLQQLSSLDGVQLSAVPRWDSWDGSRSSDNLLRGKPASYVFVCGAVWLQSTQAWVKASICISLSLNYRCHALTIFRPFISALLG